MSVELAPHALSPTAVRHREVQAILVEVVPVFTRDDVSQWVGERVRHHLRVTGGTRGEVEQHDVVVVVAGRSHERSGGIDSLVEVEPALRDGRTDGYAVLQRRRLRHGIVDMVDDDVVAACDDRLDVGRVAAIDDIFVGEEVGRRDHHCSDLVEGDDGEPELIAAFQDQHDHVTLPDAEGLKIGGGLVRLTLHVRECEIYVLALVVGPTKGHFVWVFFRPCVDYIVAEVEMLRNI